MKHLIAILLAIALCLGVATAEESPFFHISLWNAEDIDLSGVKEVDGRLVGVVKLPETTRFGLPTAELRVDCPLPVEFAPEQKATLHVVYRDIIQEYDEQEIDNGYFANRLSDAALEPSTPEGEQAKGIVRGLIESFGGKAAEGNLHANPRDAIHADPYSRMESSTAAEMSDKRRAHFEALEAKHSRAGQNITMVRGLYELNGLPVMDQYYEQVEEDWVGASSEFRAAVRSDGTLLFAEISGLPQVVSQEPLELPAFDWQTLLRNAIANLCATNACPQDEVRADGSTYYAGYSVITDLKPCWVGKTTDTLVPGWYCTTQQRVAQDNSLAAIFALYGDAQTLMSQ